MKQELQAIENLTSEIKELNNTLNVLAATQFAGIKLMNNNSMLTGGKIKAKIAEGLSIINELSKNM
jgi:hypothetical protein